MRTITLEEHFATPAFLDGPGAWLAGDPALAARLGDLGAGRVAEMDAAGIDVQVLSLGAPGVEQSPPARARALARSTNDALAAAVREHPDRFAGLAAVPTPDPEAAPDELERAVSELGMVGAVLNGHAAGRYLDHAAFGPLLDRAEALSAPLYLHPTRPPEPVVAASYSGLSPAVDAVFATSGWGWHIETAVHLLRMVLGGVFDRHPRLQVVVGHMGEGLPFLQTRLGQQFPTELT